jgi:hypothetical protein
VSKTLSGRRGDEANVLVNVGGGKANIDHLSMEEDLLFVSLKQHTENLDLWESFDHWKDRLGHYISSLSAFYYLLRKQVTAKTGLSVTEADKQPGLTPHFARTVFTDAYSHALFGPRGFEGVAHTIASTRDHWYQLRLNGYAIASASNKRLLKRCQKIHSQMLDYYRDSRNHSKGLKISIDIRLRLEKLESEIFLMLQKLILRHTFLGRRDLCPDQIC